jgi:quinol monooxygenase YgiN
MKNAVKYVLSPLFFLAFLTNCKMEKNNELDQTYTLGIWMVKPGMETRFIDEWVAFARWTSGNFEGPGRAYLLQDGNNSTRFISFGPWSSTETIQRWRETEEFQRFVAKAKELCNDFQPNTLNVVATSD